MAQSINEVQDELMQYTASADSLPAIDLLTENEQQTLGNITSESKVSVFRKLVYVVAKAIVSLQELWDVFKAEIETLIAESRPFTKKWYRETALAYQHGDVLNIWNKYDQINTFISIQ